MYQFVTGPLVWVTFIVFFVGIIARIVMYVRGLDWKLDRVTYSVNTEYGMKGAIRSLLYWMIPFAARGWKTHPVFTVITFSFHLSLFVSVFLLSAHNILLERAWGIRLITIPDKAGDILAILVMVSVIMFVVRRLVLPEVRVITTPHDYIVLLIAVAPFITGFCAYHQLFNYDIMIIAHVLSGEIMIIAIPFTKLSHFVLFFLSRIQIGMDFGIKRGGMKGKGLVW